MYLSIYIFIYLSLSLYMYICIYVYIYIYIYIYRAAATLGGGAGGQKAPGRDAGRARPGIGRAAVRVLQGRLFQPRSEVGI